ncbi:MAG: NAD(P)-dependent oxidoreductase [Acidimicrobiales bacterium]
MLRILSHVGRLDAIHIPSDIAERVEVIAIPMDGEIDADLVGEVLITTPTNVPTLEEALSRGVRWVHLIGTGIDKFPVHLIGDDLVLTNSRGLSAVPISEWVMACMLSFVKRMPGSFVTSQPSHWNIPTPSFATLDGANLSILGLGGIGTAIATRALSFGMNVTAMRYTDAPSPIEGVRMVRSAADLVAEADHIVLVAPLTDSTRGLFNEEVFAAMKTGVQLINVARGPIIDDGALLRALDSGIVACADIDATEPEPLPDGHWMYTHPSVRLSPHVSWNWGGAFQAMYTTFIDNLRLYLNDDPLLSVVNPADGY